MKHGTHHRFYLWCRLGLSHVALLALTLPNAHATYITAHNNSPCDQPVGNWVIQRSVNGGGWINSCGSGSLAAGAASAEFDCGNYSGSVQWRIQYFSVGGCLAGTGPTISTSLFETHENLYINAVSQNWNYNKCVTNNTPFSVTYTGTTRDTVTGQVTPISSSLVPPGTWWCFSINTPHKMDIDINQDTVFYGEDGTPGRTNREPVWSATGSDQYWWQDGNSPNNAPDITKTTDPTTRDTTSLTNSTIAFDNSTTDLAKEATLQTVGSALRRSQAEGFNAVVNAILGLKGVIGSSGNANNSALGAKLDTLHSDNLGLGGKLDTLHTDNGTTQGKIDTGNTWLSSIDSRIATGNNSLGSIAGSTALATVKLEDIKGYLAGVQSRLDSGNTTSASELAQLQALNLTTTTIKDGINIIAPNSTAIKTAIEDIDTIMPQIKQSVQQGTTATQGLGTKLDDIKTSVDNAGGTLTTISVTADGIKTATQAIKPVLDTGTNILGDIKAEIKFQGDRNNQNLAAISNRLNQSPSMPDTAAQVSAGTAAAEDVRSQLAALGSAVPAYSGSATFANGQTQWQIVVAGHTFNLNPLANADMANLASYTRLLLTWLITLCTIVACFMCIEEYVRAAPMARQAQASGTAVMGTNLNTVIALVCAALITTALAAVPLFYFTYFPSPFVIFLGNPLDQNLTTPIRMALGLADAFIPLALIFTNVLLYVGFRMKAAAVWWLATTITRFIVG